ncbi:glycosyltransferase [Candidatus Woesearchaeota archaeon]|nr:glycosyltransferase [Candidatus Woesearchaeota archaeon]
MKSNTIPNKMLSIIIPTLNEEKYINKLLNTLKNQFYTNFEVIVVDCGSTDATEQVVNKFRHRFKRLDFIRTNEKNASKQRNTGAKVAVGDILIFLDADMILYDQHFLSNIVKVFKAQDYFSALVTYIMIDPKEATVFDNLFFAVNNFWLKILSAIGIHISRGGCMVVKKQIFDKIKGFNEQMFVAEDIDLFRRLSKAARIKDTDLVAHESARRYRQVGYLKLWWHWTVNGIWCFLFKKSLIKEWKPVR